MAGEKRIKPNKARSDSIKNRASGFSDPSGLFPRLANINAPTTNEKARGVKRVHVETGGACADIDLELKKELIKK